MPDPPPTASPSLVVVTGAASGIGRATALALVERNITVIGVDRSPLPAPLSANPLVSWITGDITDQATWTEVATMATSIDDQGADGIVASAGDVVVAPLLETDPDEWRRLFDINVVGLVLALRELLPAMVERRSGAVVAVCSVNSLFVEDQLSAYSTTKAAMLQVVRSAALEHARDGVRINAVLPGAVHTPMLRRHLDTTDDPLAARLAIERRTPTGRVVTPDEVANVICFLLTPDSTGMSGSAVVVDGGMTTAYDFARGFDQ